MIRLTEATRARLRELDREKRSALAPAKLADKIRRRADRDAARAAILRALESPPHD